MAENSNSTGGDLKEDSASLRFAYWAQVETAAKTAAAALDPHAELDPQRFVDGVLAMLPSPPPGIKLGHIADTILDVAVGELCPQGKARLAHSRELEALDRLSARKRDDGGVELLPRGPRVVIDPAP